MPVLLNVLLRAGLIHGDAITCTGQTLAQSLAAFPTDFPAGQDVVFPLERPFAPALAHIVVVRVGLGRIVALYCCHSLDTRFANIFGTSIPEPTI